MEEQNTPKKMSKIKQHIVLSIITVVLSLIMFQVGYHIWFNLTADQEGFDAKLQEICEFYKMDFLSCDNDIYKFSVDSDIWETRNLSSKMRYCLNVHEAIRKALYFYHIEGKNHLVLIKYYGRVPNDLGWGCVADSSNVNATIYY